MKYSSLQERILANTVKEGDCWLYIGTLNNNGYGRISLRLNGKHVKRLAHRVAYVVFTMPCSDLNTELNALPELAHSVTCRSRACINPGHLSPSNRSKNVAQVWQKKKALATGGKLAP